MAIHRRSRDMRSAAIVISCLLLGCARPVDATSDRETVLAAIKRFSGKYEVDNKHPDRPVVELSLISPYTKFNPLAPVYVNDEDLALLTALPNLKKLAVHSKNVTAVGLAHLKGLKGLQSLELEIDSIKVGPDAMAYLRDLIELETLNTNLEPTDEAMLNLDGLVKLRSLRIGGWRLTAAGVSHLKGMTELESFETRAAIDDACLDHLKRLRKLHTLKADLSKVTDAGMPSLCALRELQSIDLNPRGPSQGGKTITDAGFAHIGNMTKLKRFRMPSRTTDEALRNMRSLVQLEELDADETKVTDAGLVHLRDMKDLQKLTLSGTRVSHAGIPHLKPLRRLETLSVRKTMIAGEALAHLADLENLKVLYLDATAITDADLLHLKGLRKLKCLSISHMAITDAGLEHLKRCPSLEDVTFVDTKATDEGLRSLKDLPNLTRAFFSGCQVSKEGITELRQAHPKAWIRD